MSWIENSELQIGHHKEYAERYIIGRPIAGLNGEFKWANNFLKNLAKEVDMSDKYSVIPW